MISPYFGEFLVNPVPLHLILPKCSYKCSYCFVGDKKTDFNYFKNQLNNSDKNNSWLAQLLKEKYPVCVSNASDPFAPGVDDVFFQMKDMLDEHGIRICYQTKGGKKCIETLDKEPPTFVYFTVTSDNDKIIKQYEVNTPFFQERIEAIEHIAKRHFVVIGLNPFIPEWWIDIESFIGELNRIGIKHIWHGNLHINKKTYTQQHFQKYKELLSLGCLKEKPYQRVYDYYINYIDNQGINCFSGATSLKLGFWDEYFKLFKWFPTLDEWFSILHKQNVKTGMPIAFTVSDFNAFLKLPFYQVFYKYHSSFGRTLRNVKKDNSFQVRNMPEFLDILFDPVNYPTVFRHDNIFVLVENNETYKPEMDDNRSLILVYDYLNDETITKTPDEISWYKGGD
jgi:DNA repair photolyase